LSFDLRRSLRRLKPARRTTRLSRRPDTTLPFVSEKAPGGPELLLDTCVYVDVLQRRAPERLKNLLAVRLCNHSGITLAELTHLFGRLDPRDDRTAVVTAEISAVILDMPAHRLTAPSTNVLGEAGILAGLAARLAGIRSGPALLNDAALYLQAIEQGQTLLTRNVREFDWFDQLLPTRRVLFYRQA
jgi:predicted nucleic acid-binding protein